MSNSDDNKGNFDWRDNSIEWNKIIKKEARGYEKGDDLGEVQDIGQEFVVTERGHVLKHKFYLPKHLVKGYDGDTLWFNITEEDAEDNFKRDHPPKEGEYSRYRSASVTQQYNESSPTSESSDNPNRSQSNYSLEDRLPLIEKQNRALMILARENHHINSVIEDWDSILHKGVRTKEMQSVGNVMAVTESSIIITSEGAKEEYNVPKEEVESYNGSEVT